MHFDKFKHFTLKFLRWTHPSSNLDMSVGISFKYQHKMGNSVDPDEAAHYDSVLICRDKRVKGHINLE